MFDTFSGTNHLLARSEYAVYDEMYVARVAKEAVADAYVERDGNNPTAQIISNHSRGMLALVRELTPLDEHVSRVQRNRPRPL